MAAEIIMPQLGLTMTEGTVTKWLKAEGESVAVGDLLVEISTDKITNQIESSVGGVLLKIMVPEGKVAPVKSIIAYIGEPGETVGEPQEEPSVDVVETLGESPVEIKKEKSFARPTDGRVKASPLAKKIAKDKDLSLENLEGTGPEGRIVARDVENLENRVMSEKVLASPLAKKIAEEHGVYLEQVKKDGRIMSQDVKDLLTPHKEQASTTLSGMRKIIAERLSQSWQQAPHVHMSVEVDMSEAAALRKRISEKQNSKFSYTELITKACAQVIHEFPEFCNSIVGDQVFTSSEINIGMAVAIDQGLVVPVIRQAYGKSLIDLRNDIAELGGKARNGQLSPDDMSGAVFTISNLGMYGVDHFTPVINPPESAILGVCRIVDKPIVVAGEIVIRPMMNLVMSFDHRLIDGAVGAQFMKRLRELLEEPLLMI